MTIEGLGIWPPSSPSVPSARSAALMAHVYRLRGWSLFPLPRGQKIPDRPWRQFQSYRPSDHVVEVWFRQRPDANVAIVTGAVSGLVVADLDLAKAPEVAREFAERCGGELPAAPTVRTGSGGLHLYFQHPGVPVRSRVGLFPGCQRSPHTEPPGSGKRSHPGSPNLSQPGSPIWSHPGAAMWSHPAGGDRTPWSQPQPRPTLSGRSNPAGGEAHGWTEEPGDRCQRDLATVAAQGT
jgi:hypothetical protein